MEITATHLIKEIRYQPTNINGLVPVRVHAVPGPGTGSVYGTGPSSGQVENELEKKNS